MTTLLDNPITILDKNYVPIKIGTVKNGISLLFSEKALVIDPTFNTYTIWEWIEYSKTNKDPTIPVIRSASLNLVIPEVVIIPTYMRKIEHLKKLKYSRNSVLKRDSFTCMYCGTVKNRHDLTVDHIIPRSKGGKSVWLNIVTSCKPCNTKKADKTLQDVGMKLLKLPRIPTWTDDISLPKSFKKELEDKFS